MYPRVCRGLRDFLHLVAVIDGLRPWGSVSCKVYSDSLAHCIFDKEANHNDSNITHRNFTSVVWALCGREGKVICLIDPH